MIDTITAARGEERSGTADPLSWSVYEFEKKDRHPDWLWYVGLVFGIGATVSFFYGNIFFGIFLIIAGIVLIVYAFRDPKLLVVTFHEEEIDIQNGVLPHSKIRYEKIRAFALDETTKPDKLLLQVEGSFVPTLVIPLAGISAAAIRNALKEKQVTEGELRESTSAKLFDHFGY